MLPAPEVDGWIRGLRERLERGDLADLAPIDLGYGPPSLPGEVVVRILLHDLDDLEAQIRAGTLSIASPRWGKLLDEFRRLRDLIG